ncbi:MAG: HAMP domain-containing sensor histidine kinase, partial [Planctomycetota bacterium]
NYNVTLPQPSGDDEVANLIKTFNGMLKELRGYHTSLESKIEEARHKIKTTQEQLTIAQRLSATGTLAAGIAHEINNPLGGIMNAVQSLKKGNLPLEKTREYLDLILDGLQRMQETLKKILQFFPRKLVPQGLELKPVIERTLQLVQHRLEEYKITVANLVPANIPQVFGDATELQQVFLNLLMNAIDAIINLRETQPELTDRGQIKLLIELSGKNITVSLTDDGAGMDAQTLEHAFDIFYTTKEPGRGTGLGLAVVHNIIENHGGKIYIQSKKGRGTTIKITLPVLQETLELMTSPEKNR